jgi:hypothetical protein
MFIDEETWKILFSDYAILRLDCWAIDCAPTFIFGILTST